MQCQTLNPDTDPDVSPERSSEYISINAYFLRRSVNAEADHNLASPPPAHRDPAHLQSP